jgi:ABC-type Fe3+-siderophore transport system permease subunit
MTTLLAGIALSAMIDAVIGVLSATGDPRAVLLMRRMSGSTYLVTATTATVEIIIDSALISIAFALRRWLDILEDTEGGVLTLVGELIRNPRKSEA